MHTFGVRAVNEIDLTGGLSIRKVTRGGVSVRQRTISNYVVAHWSTVLYGT